jgi:hypothetical protein
MKNVLSILSYRKAVLTIFSLFICLNNSGYAADITLKWAPNTEPDLAGYKIYYKKGFSGAPYDGVDIDQSPSPILLTIADPDDPYYVDPDNPEFLLTGLGDNEDYFLVVTAYDNEEPYNESGFSNEVNTLGDEGVGDANTSGESSCFISSSVFSSKIDCLENHPAPPGKTAKNILVHRCLEAPLRFTIMK